MSVPWGSNMVAYLQRLRTTRAYDDNIIHLLADHAVRRYHDFYDIYKNLPQIRQCMNAYIYVDPVCSIVIEYLDFGIEQMKQGIRLYLTCPNTNIADIIISCVFQDDLNLKLTLPEMKTPPKGSVFDGTKMVLYNSDNKILYRSHNIIAVIEFDRPMMWAVSADDDFKYNVFVITQDGTTIKTYSIDKYVFFKGYRKPIHTGNNIFYGQLYHELATKFEYYVD